MIENILLYSVRGKGEHKREQPVRCCLVSKKVHTYNKNLFVGALVATMPEARIAREVLSYEQEGAFYGQEAAPLPEIGTPS